MSLLIILALVVILIVQSRSRTESEQTAYRRGYSEGYWRARREADPNATAKTTLITPSTAETPVGQPSSTAPLAIDKASLDAQKQKSKNQTLNVTLYAASLLLVGGVVLFTDAILDHQIALFIVAWTIVAAYYGVGLILYESSTQLKSVAVAFIGTALAALPFVGMLFTTLLDMSGSSAWLITSSIALIAYIYAALRLRSEVLGYAITAVVVSSGLSLVSVLGAGVVWFFVMTLAVAVAMGLVANRLLPNSSLAYLVQPLAVVGRWLPLATLALSLILGSELAAYDYTLIWLVAGIYYLVRAIDVKQKVAVRNENWIMARLVLSFTALFYTYALTDSGETLAVVAALVGVGQVAASTWLTMNYGKSNDLQRQNEVLLWFGLGLALVAPVMMSFGVEGDESAQTTAIVTLSMTVVASLVSAWLLRRVELGYLATAALLFLPGIAVYHFVDNATASTYAWGYLDVALIATGFRIWRESAASNAEKVYYHITVGLIGGLAALALLGSDSQMVQMAGLLVLAAIYYALAWCDRQPWVALVGNLMLVGVMRALFDRLDMSTMEIVGAIAFFATILFASLHLLVMAVDERYKKLSDVMLMSAVACGVFFGILSVASSGVYANLAMLGMIISGTLVLVNRQLFGGSLGLLFGAAVVTLAMQRMFGLAVPDVSMLFYAHWWAIVLWLLGYLEYKSDKRQNAKAYGYTGLGIVSLFGLSYALSGDSIWYQALFIVEHSLLLLVGLVKSWRSVTIWGAVGVTLAILWMFRGFTSLFLTLIGIIIILVVIWIVRREASR